jgi:hypothetical protein
MKTYEPSIDDEVTAEESRWIDFVEEQAMRSHEVYRDAGKTMLQIMVVLLPGYAAVVAALLTQVPGGVSWLTYSPLIAWALTLTAALVAVYPPMVRYRSGDVDGFKQRFTRFVLVKRWAFMVACVTLALGVAIFLIGLRDAVGLA